MTMLSQADLDKLVPAESRMFASPIPVQSVSSDEFLPEPQSPRQKMFEARIKDMGSTLAKQLGLSRRWARPMVR